MVKRRDLNPTPAQELAALIDEMRASGSQGHTVPTGIKDLGTTGDVVWRASEDGQVVTRSVREASERIAAAEVAQAEAREALAAAEVQLEDTAGGLDRLETVTLPGAVERLEAADREAQEDLAALDARLAGAVSSGDLDALRADLQVAQDAVVQAQRTADAATTAASAANKAALEAAGIADAKGRVIYSEQEPAEVDRSPSNLWIKPSTEETRVWNGQAWELITSELLDQAAQNALDAKDAASKAQSTADAAAARAETAVANAAAAKRTADQATLDAADAHNAAVAARARVDSVIESGASLLINGSFEDGDTGWPVGGSHGGRSRIIADDGARTGQYVLEVTPSTANTYPESDRITVTPGQVLYVRGWMKHLGGDGTVAQIIGRTLGPTGVSTGTPTVRIVNPQSYPVGEWVLLDGDFVVPDGTSFMRFAFHANGPTTSVFHFDDLQVVDVTEARKAQAQAEKALQDALAALATARGEITSEIRASANGKNAITISTAAPSGPGVVAGDTWWRIDGSGNIFGQWRWTGSAWSAVTIRSEVIANLDVHKLQVTGSAQIAQAVIEKLWVDGLAAKAITASSVNVGPGNIIPDGITMEDDSIWTNLERDTSDTPPGLPASRRCAPGSPSQQIGMAFVPVEPGKKYVAEAWIKADKPGSVFYAEMRDSSNAHAGKTTLVEPKEKNVGPYWLFGSEEVPTEWTRYQGIWTAGSDTTSARFRSFYFNYANSTSRDARVWIAGLSMRPMTGAVLIEDGAITTPKLTVTEDMAAKIVSAMTVDTKRLVVTEDAVLNHVRVVGDAIIRNINVTGKLIGQDGVFTGTVDFANVNVTGTQIVNKLAANSISAEKIAGGSFEGKSFTGGTFSGNSFFGATYATSTRPSVDGGVMIDPTNGIRGWGANTSQPTFQLFPSDGSIKIRARFRATDENDSGVQIIPTTSTGAGGIFFSERGSASGSQAAIWRSGYNANETEPLRLRGANGGHVEIQGGLGVTGGGIMVLSAPSNFSEVRADNIVHTFPPTTSAAANALIATSPAGRFYRSTSSRRYKRNIVDWHPKESAVLSLRPRQWQHADPSHPEEIDETWHVGFIAEEVHDLGLTGLVKYVGDGRGGWIPDGLNYDRFTAALIPIVKRQQERIEALEARLGVSDGSAD